MHSVQIPWIKQENPSGDGETPLSQVSTGFSQSQVRSHSSQILEWRLKATTSSLLREKINMNTLITSPCEQITTKPQNVSISEFPKPVLGASLCFPAAGPKLAPSNSRGRATTPKRGKGGGSENKMSLKKSHFIGRKRAQQKGSKMVTNHNSKQRGSFRS